ncbi:MAG TPA: DUF1993 domain-containing protein [Paracoccaceae bacterium]|nr:DUF1993 domain-containing protein [Paracoccaceae bacterium]
MSLHSFTVPPLERMLAGLDQSLAKGQAHCAARKVPEEALLAFRLYPDMFPFTRQVQLACDFAARGAARLAGQEPRAFPDTETTFATLRDRVAAARAYLAGFDPADFDGAAERSVTFRMRGGEVTMTGQDYLTGFVLPQAFFHATTAYAILRHNGVEVGKADYMGVPPPPAG